VGLVAYGVYASLAELSLSGWDFSVAGMERFIESWGRWAAIASILLMIIHSFVPLPAELLAVANGMLFGPLWGMALTWTGAMLGAYLAFGLARALGRPFVVKMLPPRHRNRLDGWVAKQGSGALLIARLVPVISFNAINYAAGLTNVSWWTFSWTTGLGILPLTALMVIIGDRVLSWPWMVWVAVAAVAVLMSLLLWRWGRRLARRRRLDVVNKENNTNA
jgi:uncharacterized membrane protein YdjX (TVP38/TMEM64 family)